MNEVLRVVGTIAPFVVLAGLVGIVIWERWRTRGSRASRGYLYQMDPHATREQAQADWSEPQPDHHHHHQGGHHGGHQDDGGHHGGWDGSSHHGG